MTAISQTLKNPGISRRTQIAATAWDSTKDLVLSDAFRRALLNTGRPGNGNHAPHKRPAYLRLYFALKSHGRHFPSSEAIRAQRIEQDAAKSRKKQIAATTRRIRHEMPAGLDAENRALWIEARKEISRTLRKSLKNIQKNAQENKRENTRAASTTASPDSTHAPTRPALAACM